MQFRDDGEGDDDGPDDDDSEAEHKTVVQKVFLIAENIAVKRFADGNTEKAWLYEKRGQLAS